MEVGVIQRSVLRFILLNELTVTLGLFIRTETCGVSSCLAAGWMPASSASYCCPVSTHGACAGPSAAGNAGPAPAVQLHHNPPSYVHVIAFLF